MSKRVTTKLSVVFFLIILVVSGCLYSKSGDTSKDPMEAGARDAFLDLQKKFKSQDVQGVLNATDVSRMTILGQTADEKRTLIRQMISHQSGRDIVPFLEIGEIKSIVPISTGEFVVRVAATGAKRDLQFVFQNTSSGWKWTDIWLG